MDTNPLSANPTKWSNTLKQCVANLPTNCLSVFDHFVGLALKGRMSIYVVGVFYTINPFPANGLFLYPLKFRKLGMK